MSEANIGSWLLIFFLLVFPVFLLRIGRISNYYRTSFFSTTLPLSLCSVIFAILAACLYYVCVFYTDLIKKTAKPEQDIINTRDRIFTGSMTSIVLCIAMLLLSFKFE